MRMRVLVIMVSAWYAAPASAQMASSRVFGWLDAHQMTAKESFDAVADTSTVSGAGAGLEVHRVWRGVFVRGAFSRMTVEGERVFVFDGTVFPLGSPLDITMTPIDLAAGWRFGQANSRVVPYVGAGASWLKYREEGEGSTSSELVKEPNALVEIEVTARPTGRAALSRPAPPAPRSSRARPPSGIPVTRGSSGPSTPSRRRT